MAKKDRKKKRSEGGALAGLWGLVKTVFYALLIAGVVRTVLYEPFNIPSASMYPTLYVGDYLFVSKYSYGYSRFSLPFSPNLFSGRILSSEPERGDVLVFKVMAKRPQYQAFPGNCNEHLMERGVCDWTDYIKRVVGLPGDRIQMRGGILHINGEPVERRRVAEDDPERQASLAEARRRSMTLYVETLPNGRSHEIFEISDDTSADNTEEFRVPEGHYFMMGDNRDQSADSRFASVGPVPHERLIGRAEILFFSTDGSAHIWEIWKWHRAIRWERLFMGVR